MTSKIFKWTRIVILILMLGAMIGLYFVQAKQFQGSKTMDILIPDFPRTLNWVALFFMAIGWIFWEWAYSKSGNRKIGFASAILIFISMFFTFNLLTFVFGSVVLVVITIVSYVYLPKKSEKKLSKALIKNQQDKANEMKEFKKVLKIKK